MDSFVDMARKPAEMAKISGSAYPATPEQPIYPYGLCIHLNQEDLEKMDLEDGFEVGDVIDMRCLAKVTSVSKNETTEGVNSRVEIQITHLATETEYEESEAPRAVKNPYKK
jgi:hypothetical protein